MLKYSDDPSNPETMLAALGALRSPRRNRPAGAGQAKGARSRPSST
jgi:hypothetical protein